LLGEENSDLAGVKYVDVENELYKSFLAFDHFLAFNLLIIFEGVLPVNVNIVF